MAENVILTFNLTERVIPTWCLTAGALSNAFAEKSDCLFHRYPLCPARISESDENWQKIEYKWLSETSFKKYITFFNFTSTQNDLSSFWLRSRTEGKSYSVSKISKRMLYMCFFFIRQGRTYGIEQLKLGRFINNSI